MFLKLVVKVILLMGMVVLVSSCLVSSRCCVCVYLMGEMLNLVWKMWCKWWLVMFMVVVSVVRLCFCRKFLLIMWVVVCVRFDDILVRLWLGVSFGW